MTLKEKIIEALEKATRYNGSLVERPEVILWPDPDAQWQSIIPVLQKEIPALLVFGSYEPEKRQGPAIWIKCMVAKTLPVATWTQDTIPIIYLPGISKQDLREVSKAGLELQPLIEYQHTGVIWDQDNGKEWTIVAFIQNEVSGLGRKVAGDNATEQAITKTITDYFEDPVALFTPTIIDADYILGLSFPDIIPNILKWMCKGDPWLKGFAPEKQQLFLNICKTRYDFVPDHRNIKDIVGKFGSQRNTWKQVWQMFSNAPVKYPELVELLRSAIPEDLGVGVYSIPKESWPQINESKEAELRKALSEAGKLSPVESLAKIRKLFHEHKERLNWVWAELGHANLIKALQHIQAMADITTAPFPFSRLEDLREYYISKGYLADQNMRKALAEVRAEKDVEVVRSLIVNLYKPWLQSITEKFQGLVENNFSIFSEPYEGIEEEPFILFVDAFRFELAKEFAERTDGTKYKLDLKACWSAIPSVTPTGKPHYSPVAPSIDSASRSIEFRPQLLNGKDLQTAAFREALEKVDFHFIAKSDQINPDQKNWQEIGEIDKKGHAEQAEVVRRINELLDQVNEAIEEAFSKGIKRILVVTDHGWLLLPGGLPKEEIRKDLTETRWGRCALIKDGAPCNLLHLPWRWNPGIFIAFAPGISFFKKNEEYAHGGISLQECLVPVMVIKNLETSKNLAKITDARWVGLTCRVTTIDSRDGFKVDIRTRFNDPSTSVILSPNRSVIGNKITLMIDDTAENQSVVVVLIDENDRIIDKKLTLAGVN
jgi:hypothetical protein